MLVKRVRRRPNMIRRFQQCHQVNASNLSMMVEQYLEDRDNCKNIFVNYRDVKCDNEFYVQVPYIRSIPYLPRCERPPLDIWTAETRIFVEKKNRYKKKHDRWIKRRTSVINVLMSRKEEIPKDVAQLIGNIFESEPGQVLITLEQFQLFMWLRIAIRCGLFGCIVCSCQQPNHAWRLTNITFEDLQNHEKSEQHQRMKKTYLDGDIDLDV